MSSISLPQWGGKKTANFLKEGFLNLEELPD